MVPTSKVHKGITCDPCPLCTRNCAVQTSSFPTRNARGTPHRPSSQGAPRHLHYRISPLPIQQRSHLLPSSTSPSFLSWQPDTSGSQNRPVQRVFLPRLSSTKIFLLTCVDAAGGDSDILMPAPETLVRTQHMLLCQQICKLSTPPLVLTNLSIHTTCPMIHKVFISQRLHFCQQNCTITAFACWPRD